MRRALVTLGVAATLTVGAGAAYGLRSTAAGDMHDQMTSMPMSSMPMSSMPMSSMPMGSMPTGSMSMGGADMDAMHAQMRAAMPADTAAACDSAHAAMTAPGATGSDSTAPADHAAHHPSS